MKKRIFALFTALILTLSMIFAIPAIAFDGNDYGGGGGNSSSSSDSDSSGGLIELSGGQLVIVLVITVVIFAVVAKKVDKLPSAGSPTSSGLPNRTEEIENIIKEHDPNFSADELIAYVKQLYVDIQLAWCKRDMESLRPVLHENLYNTTVNQIKEKIAQGVIYHYESIVVDTAYLTSLTHDDKFEYVSLYVSARMYDWQEDENTHQILRGDKTTRWTLKYKMKLMRPLEATHTGTINTDSPKCPSCGAPLEVGATSKCEYCGSIVRTDKHTWILNEFTTLRNDTVDEGVQR